MSEVPVPPLFRLQELQIAVQQAEKLLSDALIKAYPGGSRVSFKMGWKRVHAVVMGHEGTRIRVFTDRGANYKIDALRGEIDLKPEPEGASPNQQLEENA